MNEDLNTSELNHGEGARLHAGEDSMNGQTSNELGQKIDEDGEKKPSMPSINEQRSSEPSTPLFLSESSEGKKGNAQDEKDESAE